MRWLTALWPGHRVVQSHLQLPRFMWRLSSSLIIWFDFAMRHGKFLLFLLGLFLLLLYSPCCCCCCCRLLMAMPKPTYPIAASQACSAARRNNHRPSSARQVMWRCSSTRITLRIRWVSNFIYFLYSKSDFSPTSSPIDLQQYRFTFYK